MKQSESTENRVEETLNSLDGLQKASPGPFFYTRVMARMEDEQKNLWETITSYITKPFVIAAVISFVLLLNVSVVFRESGVSADLADQPDISMVDEYTIASTSFYDYSNAEP
ncbi:MAG: hypothetical protein H7122_05250 [Chitinophagaceae bacterium]|nr:hypothetical protein [Chitinophagaceae bacterium]